MPKHICILATHHNYQHVSPRIDFAKTVRELIDLWKPDFIGEEWSDRLSEMSFVGMFARVLKIDWDNIDLKSDERKYFPDSNPLGLGTVSVISPATDRGQEERCRSTPAGRSAASEVPLPQAQPPIDS